MTFVVTESCIQCKYTHCVAVCPTDAFRNGPNFLAIDPDACIDCALCVPECPVDAIFSDFDVPTSQAHFIPINVELAKEWKTISRTRNPLPEAEKWANVTDKLKFLER